MDDWLPAISYRRVSTAEQADGGYSLPKQLEYITRYAHEHRLQIVADFADDVSGLIPIEERPEGRKADDMLNYHLASAIIVHETDRLSRDIVDLLGTVKKWIRAGIQVHLCDVGQIASELDISLVIRAWQGGSEHAKIKERTQRGRIGKAEAGRWVGGSPPYGYRVNGARREAKLVVYEPEAEIVQRIYRWYTIDRVPMLTCADRLNRANIPTQRGVKWWKVIIKKILSAETYIGIIYYAGIRIELPELAIVDQATFDRAQELRRLNRERAPRNRQHEYLLANHLRCECGETMTGSTQPGPYQRVYYRCSQFQFPSSKRDCVLGVPLINGYVAEDIVWSYIKRIITDDELLRAGLEELNAARQSESASSEDELAALDQRIAAASRKISTLLNEFGDDVDTDVVKVLKAAVRDAQQERDTAKMQRAMLLHAQRETSQAADAQAAIMATLAQWRADIERADYQFKREVLDLLDVRIVLRTGPAGRTLVVTTALTRPVELAYMDARRYRKMKYGN